MLNETSGTEIEILKETEQKQAAPAQNEDLSDFITKVADPMRKAKPREQRISIE